MLKSILLHSIVSLLLTAIALSTLSIYRAHTDPSIPLTVVAISRCGAILGGVVTTKDGTVHSFPLLPLAVRDSLIELTEDSVTVIDIPCDKTAGQIKLPHTTPLPNLDSKAQTKPERFELATP